MGIFRVFLVEGFRRKWMEEGFATRCAYLFCKNASLSPLSAIYGTVYRKEGRELHLHVFSGKKRLHDEKLMGEPRCLMLYVIALSLSLLELYLLKPRFCLASTFSSASFLF